MRLPGRLIVVASMALLGGCGPSYSPQELAAVANAEQVNEALARDHKITWTEAASRDAAETRRISGARQLKPNDELVLSLRSALAVEVDAGRMTPELADYRLKEKIAAIHDQDQQRQAQQQAAFANGMIIAGQAMQNVAQQSRPINCTSNQVGTFTNTTCN